MGQGSSHSIVRVRVNVMRVAFAIVREGMFMLWTEVRITRVLIRELGIDTVIRMIRMIRMIKVIRANRVIRVLMDRRVYVRRDAVGPGLQRVCMASTKTMLGWVVSRRRLLHLDSRSEVKRRVARVRVSRVLIECISPAAGSAVLASGSVALRAGIIAWSRICVRDMLLHMTDFLAAYSPLSPDWLWDSVQGPMGYLRLG